MENWREVVGYEGLYQVSDLGNVMSCDRAAHGRSVPGRPLTLTVHHSGYVVVGLFKRGRVRQLPVHRLVAIAFLGSPASGQEVRHGDNQRQNNVLANLSWGTRVENAADKVRHGTAPIGANNPKAKLKDDDVRLVVQMISGGSSNKSAANYFGVSEITISHIMCGRTWTHITGITYLRRRAEVTDDLIAGVATLKAAGKTLDQIAVELGISKATAFRHSRGAIC